jgi:dipeptidyl aminopeptidase/acylaminoacyl peptidase
MNDRSDLDRLVTDWLRAAAPPRAPRELLPLALEQVARVGQERPLGGRWFDAWIATSPRLRWALVLVVLAALLGTIAGVGALLHRTSPVLRSGASNGWVAFAVEGVVRGSPSAIYLVRDGVSERRLVGSVGYAAGTRAVCPTFSPDGTRLAYSEATVTPTPPAIGSNELFPGSFQASDQFVVITTLDRAGSPIGTDVRIPVETGPGGDACPAWSPDGHHLAYLSRGSSDSSPGLSVADLNGNTTKTLALPVAPYARLFWSPDGTEVAAGDDSGIWLVPVAGGEPRLLLAPGWSSGDFAWSPDGTRIAVGGKPGLVFRVDDPRPVVEASLGENPTWSPDGQELASIQSADAGGIAQNQISCVGCHVEVRTIATDLRTIRGLIWSPDGKRLLYVADAGPSGALMTLSVENGGGLSGPTPLTQQPHDLEFTSSMFISWQPVFP